MTVRLKFAPSGEYMYSRLHLAARAAIILRTDGTIIDESDGWTVSAPFLRRALARQGIMTKSSFLVWLARQEDPDTAIRDAVEQTMAEAVA